jgi:predicted outer membrane repeat protein
MYCDLAGGGAGGAILIDHGATCNIDAATFLSNDAANGRGGAIYNVGTLTVKLANFTSNYAGSVGGAICIGIQWGGATSGIAIISYSEFTSNSATNEQNSPAGIFDWGGGAIWIEKNGQATISYANFTSNWLNSHLGRGGAIYNNCGTLTVKFANFTSNSASIGGGAICIAEVGHAAISHADFTNNSGGSEGAGGGAIFIDDIGSAAISYASFTLNSAIGGSGGAIHHAGTLLNVSAGTVFTKNSATTEGGAIFVSGPAEIHMPE